MLECLEEGGTEGDEGRGDEVMEGEERRRRRGKKKGYGAYLEEEGSGDERERRRSRGLNKNGKERDQANE